MSGLLLFPFELFDLLSSFFVAVEHAVTEVEQQSCKRTLYMYMRNNYHHATMTWYEVTNEVTNAQPDAESRPRQRRKFEHQVNVDEDGRARQHWHSRRHEAQPATVLRLTQNDDDTKQGGCYGDEKKKDCPRLALTDLFLSKHE